MRFLITRVCAFSSFIASFRLVHLGNFNCISGRLQSDLYARAVLYGFGQCWFLLRRRRSAAALTRQNGLFTGECKMMTAFLETERCAYSQRTEIVLLQHNCVRETLRSTVSCLILFLMDDFGLFFY
jgi:hypothetical protein